MTGTQRNSDYFVVGGPVQPDRSCYVVRDADASLYSHLVRGDMCHVLAPHHTGKTSLMAHTVARLRADGLRVATVDLAQISNRDISDDPGRWYYSVAYRIVRELRIRSDMQTWWQERSGLTNMQRLRAFFLEIVLAEPDDHFVIFVDRVEAALGRPVARGLFGAIRACHDGRATEPEYARLTFALLGSATVGQLVPSGSASPFAVSSSIGLRDFDREEVRQLSAGLPGNAASIDRVADRVWYWTQGHPYLSQKVLRALARRTDGPPDDEEIDGIVATMFFNRSAPREESHLSALVTQLVRESPGKVNRLSVYGRLCKGGSIAADPDNDAHRDLLRSGVVITDAAGNLSIRNRIYAGVLTAQWANENLPFGWKGLAVAALIIGFLVGLPIWYTEYLPRPYLRILAEPDQDFVTAQDAYRRLRFLPGFADTADKLFSDYLSQESRSATRYLEAERFSERISEIPGMAERGPELLGDFWDRRVSDAMHNGDRDLALLFAARALELETPQRRQVVGELIGTDYAALIGTLRASGALEDVRLDQASGLVALSDHEHTVSVWQVDRGAPRQMRTVQLVAEETIPLQRRLLFQGQETARRLVLGVRTDHSRPADVLVELRSPSGRQVAVRLSADSLTDDGREYRIDSARNSELKSLLGEDVTGTWTAFFVDTLQGVGGTLLDWRIELDGIPAVQPPGVSPDPVLLPEPGAARETRSLLSPDGRRALSWPADPAARGEILVWNVIAGEVIARLPRPADFSGARFALGHSHVLVGGARTLEVWDIEKAERRLTIAADAALAPVLSDNGRYLVVDSVEASNENVLTVWDLRRLVETGRLQTGNIAELVAIDSNGAYLAVGDGEGLVRVWSARDAGRLVAEFPHGAAPVRIEFDPMGRVLATQDAANTFRLWGLPAGREPLLVRTASSPWATGFSGDSLFLGSPGRDFQVFGVTDAAPRSGALRHSAPRWSSELPPADGAALVAAEQGLALTWDGDDVVKIWRLPELESDGAPVSGAAVRLAAISPDGQTLALATRGGDLRIVPAGQTQLLLSMSTPEPDFIGHLAPLSAVEFSSAGDLVASGAIDGSIRIWDVTTGAPRNFFSSHGDGAVLDFEFSRDGARLVSASRRSVIVTDTATGEQLAQVAIQAERPRLILSADGRQVLVAADYGGISRWLWRAGSLEPLLQPDLQIVRAAVNDTETLLATVDASRFVQVWNLETLESVSDRMPVAAAVDDIWFLNSGDRLMIQAGTWLHTLRFAGSRLEPLETRLLAQAPVVARPSSDGRALMMLDASNASRPKLLRQSMSKPAANSVTDSPGRLESRIEAATGLRFNRWGQPETVQPF